MDTPFISAADVTVHYGAKQALFDIDLDIHANRVTALIGPSGCGKSTFLRAINRMNDLIPACRFAGSLQICERIWSCVAPPLWTPARPNSGCL